VKQVASGRSNAAVNSLVAYEPHANAEPSRIVERVELRVVRV
jgi:hypothetical protein